MSDGTGAPTSKIRIKIGQIEVEYEGAHSFLDKDLQKLLSTIVELRQKVGDLGDADELDDAEEKKGKRKGVKHVASMGMIRSAVRNFSRR
jgi:hypothetical protein